MRIQWHLAPAANLVLARDWNVVLRLAGDHAGVATGAALRSIDMPRRTWRRRRIVGLEGVISSQSEGDARRGCDARKVALSSLYSANVPSGTAMAGRSCSPCRRRVDGVMILRGGEFVSCRSLGDGRCASRIESEPRSLVEVEAGALADAALERAAVAERERD